jgi:hypothetical protein
MMTRSAPCDIPRRKTMARPAGLATKTKDNSRKKFREHDEWMEGKRIGRPAQQFNAELNTWAKIMLPKKVMD